MNSPSGPLSPVSIDGEWPNRSRYPSSEHNSYSRSYSPSLINPSGGRSNLNTPPISGSGFSSHGSESGGMNQRPLNNRGTPPISNGGSSDGRPRTSDGARGRNALVEESVAQHYATLKRYLAQTLRDEKGNLKPNRARDKLLRLSSVQFQELSTDVYDELLRRQVVATAERDGRPTGPNHLLPKDNFHPKRNQARQKLSTLPSARFRDLATDVFYELERRFPHFAPRHSSRGSPAPSIRGPSRQGTQEFQREPSRPGERTRYPPRRGSLSSQRSQGSQYNSSLGLPIDGLQENGFGRPTAKASQSNTIVPNKSTLVEDDDDQTGPEDNEDTFGLNGGTTRDTSKTSFSVSDKKAIGDYEIQISSLQSKLNNLEDLVKTKDSDVELLNRSKQDIERMASNERSQSTQLRTELEGKLNSALSLNRELQSELDRVQSHHAENEQSLRGQLDDLMQQSSSSRDGGEWKGLYEELQQDHQELRRELREQQHVTDEVRQEASTFLSEMRAISERSEQNWEREEKLVQQVHHLENEVADWKARYTRAKTQVRTLKTGSTNYSMNLQDVSQLVRDGGLSQPDGLIKDVHVTKFQLAIDGILKASHGGEPESLNEGMLAVVSTIRHLNKDLGDAASGSSDSAAQIARLKIQVSSAANNLITATKNFLHSRGLSPVSLVDAAASNLAAAVVQLVQRVKIRPTPVAELEQEDDAMSSFSGGVQSPSLFSVTNGQGGGGRNDDDEHVYSPLSSMRYVPPMPAMPGSLPSPGYAKFRDSLNGVAPLKPAALKPSLPMPKLGFGMREHDGEIEDLKNFLDAQADALVNGIESLVATIRGAPSGPASEIRAHASQIAAIVGAIVKETQLVIDATGNALLANEARPVIVALGGYRDQVLAADRGALPPLAFDITREVKELVLRVDGVAEEGNDFS